MFPDLTRIQIFIRPGHTDMRKAINGLALLTSEHMASDPLNGSLYLFCNRQRRILKALYWDKNGFCLWQKRLEKHKFPWPKTAEAVRALSNEQLDLLLRGIDFWNEHTDLNYKTVS